MAKPKSFCSSLPAPRWLLLLALGLIIFFVLALIAQTLSRHNKWASDGFTQPTSSLIYVYMDGCGHCKAFSKTWTDFTTKYHESLTAAGVETKKIRNDEAEAIALNISGYPTIMMIKSDRSSPPVAFTGARSLKSLAEFVGDNVPSFTV